MQIVWKGQACFQIGISKGKQDQVKILIDPFEDSLGLRLSPQEADIVLVTHSHFDHNNVKVVRGTPFVIDSPGEYEVKVVFVHGIATFHDDVQGKERGLNTVYTLSAECITLCHLGDFGQKELTPEQVEKIGQVHVLMIPVGGIYTVNGKEAGKIISQIEPNIIIPMHYALPGLKVKLAPVDEFLHAMGKKGLEAVPKLSLKEKDVSGEREEAEIVVLRPQ
ncbi:MAG: MBL fold metallo-hydrolase [bacterium]|nr:MBL fold metallo-hydrolase [bacterium]